MRIFKFWRMAQTRMIIDGEEKTFSCFGGSNHSETDALNDGLRRLEAVKRRIAGLDKGKEGDYEGDIREEPLLWLADRDVVTRNRYGAEVLNSTSCVFVDIDEPVLSIWQLFRRIRTREQKKQSILDFLHKRFRKPDLKGFAIRVYETHSGVRLILEGKDLPPRSEQSRNLMRSLRADWLYATLCIKQNCYRARLTPKPYRIKMKPIRLKYPYEETDRQRLDAWIAQYNAKSENYCVCRLVETFGNVSPSQTVRYHDERTGVRSNRPLA